jgi:hypothetical protein
MSVYNSSTMSDLLPWSIILIYFLSQKRA